MYFLESPISVLIKNEIGGLDLSLCALFSMPLLGIGLGDS